MVHFKSSGNFGHKSTMIRTLEPHTNFKKGDQVLILLPTSENKLLMHWTRTSLLMFEILERVEGHDYLVKLDNKQKISHANLLKKYLSANPLESSDKPFTRNQPVLPTTLLSLLFLNRRKKPLRTPQNFKL